MIHRSFIRFLSLLVVVVFSGALAYGLDLRKQWHLWVDMQHQTKNLNVRLTAQREKVSRCASYCQQFAKATLAEENLLKQLPAQHDPTQWVETLTQVSESAGLAIRSLRWLTEDHPLVADVFPIEICLEGSYHAFGVFLSDLMALSRVVTLHDFSIQSSNSSESIGPFCMNITLKVYSYQSKNKKHENPSQLIEAYENQSQIIEDHDLAEDHSSKAPFIYAAFDLRDPFELNKSGFSPRNHEVNQDHLSGLIRVGTLKQHDEVLDAFV